MRGGKKTKNTKVCDKHIYSCKMYILNYANARKYNASCKKAQTIYMLYV